MEIERHLKRAWEVWRTRWQEAVVVSLLPLAMLLLVPLMIVLINLVAGGAVVAAILISAALTASGVTNATAWTIVAVSVIVILAVAVAILVMLPFIAISFVIRACVNPTLAQMVAGGKGGLGGFWRVLREDWPMLLLTDIIVFAPMFVLTGVIILPVIALSVAFPPFGIIVLCMALPILLAVGVFNVVWMYLTEHATFLVRLEGLSPIAAVKASITLSRKRPLTLVPVFAGFFAVNMVSGQVPFLGILISQLVAYPLWVMYNASVYLEERDMGKGARTVESRYVVS